MQAQRFAIPRLLLAFLDERDAAFVDAGDVGEAGPGDAGGDAEMLEVGEEDHGETLSMCLIALLWMIAAKLSTSHITRAMTSNVGYRVFLKAQQNQRFVGAARAVSNPIQSSQGKTKHFIGMTRMCLKSR